MNEYQSELYFCKKCRDYHELLSNGFGEILVDTCRYSNRQIPKQVFERAIKNVEEIMKNMVFKQNKRKQNEKRN